MTSSGWRERLKSFWVIHFSEADKISIRNDIVVVAITGLAIGAAGLVVTGLFSFLGSDDDVVGTDLVVETNENPAGATRGDVVGDCTAELAGGSTRFESLRIGDSEQIDVTSCDVTLLQVPVRENGVWLLIQILCEEGSEQLAAPLIIEPDSSLNVVWNPAPITECQNNPVFSNVSANPYEFRVRPGSIVASGKVKIQFETVKPPNEELHEGRTVLPFLPTKLSDTFGGTIHPGTIHAHPIQIETALRLAISPACPLDQTVMTRVVDSSAVQVFEQIFEPGSCDDDWLTPELSAEDRYELQVFANDPSATLPYRMNTLSQGS